MKPKELALFFGVDEIDILDKENLENLFETYFFELKKFIISKIAVEKLLASRLKKLDKLQEITDFFDLPFSSELKEEDFDSFEIDSDFILPVFNAYLKKNMELKAKLLNSNCPLEVKKITKSLIELEKKYAEKWFLEHSWGDDTKISETQDSMLLLQAIKEFNGESEKTFDDLKNNPNNAPILLVNEMKRLSLLFKHF
jgi:hypothetical protein